MFRNTILASSCLILLTVWLRGQEPPKPSPTDGIWLSTKDYQKLLEQAKSKDANRTSPSGCQIVGRVRIVGEQLIATLKLHYAFRTTTPRSSVWLGNLKAYPFAASNGTKSLPILESNADGLFVLIERPGDHTLTLEVETPITLRSNSSELGWELGLPRAAITTLAFTPPDGVKKLMVGTRTTELKRNIEDAANLAPQPNGVGAPLGPIDLLEVSWEPPLPNANNDRNVTVETDTTIRVDETQIESTAKVKFIGAAREWLFIASPQAEVSATRPSVGRVGGNSLIAPSAIITRPADANQPWKINTPEAGEWQLTITTRTPRPDSKDAKYGGPYLTPPPWFVGVPKQSGSIRVFAPVDIRVSAYTTSAELRRQDVLLGPDSPLAAFRYASADTKPPTFQFEARPARGFLAVQPIHKLELFPDGWHLRTEVRVSPVRRYVDQITLELASGWTDPTVLPFERIDEVQIGKDANGKRLHTIKLAQGERDPFTLTIETRFPVAMTANELSLILPRFPQAVERDTQLSVAVQEGLSVKAVVRELIGGQLTNVALKPSQPVKPGTAITQLTGAFDTPIASVELAWQTFRPEILSDFRVDVTLGERQMLIAETIRFQAADPIMKSIRLRGGKGAIALQSSIPLDATLGGWQLTPLNEAREFTVTLTFAALLPPRSSDGAPARIELPLIWPEASRTTAQVRIWGTPSLAGRRVLPVLVGWEERAPEPAADRDSLPWLTLATTSSPPLQLDLIDQSDVGGLVIERATIQASSGDGNSLYVRARYLLKRWSPLGVEIELPTNVIPIVFANKDRVDSLTSLGDSAHRVSLPEVKPNRPTLTLEIQYSVQQESLRTLSRIPPPKLRGAVYQSPLLWHIVGSPSTEQLVWNGLVPDVRWHWRSGLPSPASGVSSAEVDRWFTNGSLEPAHDDGVAGRQATPTAVTLATVPRITFLIFCSLVGFLISLIGSRMADKWLGVTIVCAGISMIVGIVLMPQAAAKVFAAALPGFAVAGGVLCSQAGWRWWQRRRVTHLASFSRGGPLGEIVVSSASGTNTRGSGRPVVSVPVLPSG